MCMCVDSVCVDSVCVLIVCVCVDRVCVYLPRRGGYVISFESPRKQPPLIYHPHREEGEKYRWGKPIQ